MAPADMSLTERLVAILARPVERVDLERAALHVLDWLGCAIAGRASAVGEVFSRAAPAGGGIATIVNGPRTLPREAAFANGAFGNVLEMDDVHRAAILHPGPVVMPAALAFAEAEGMRGATFLPAVVRGYEAMIRLGRAVGPGHYARFHNTATCGPIGAAAAVADLAGLPKAQVVDAIGNAVTQAGGLWQCRHEPVMTKQLHTARAAAMGFGAAMLAARGLTGPRFILEGPQGFFAGLCPDGVPELVVAAPNDPWLVHATSFKPWPACRHCHPVIDAALALREGTDPERISSITVETYRDAVVFCDRETPTTEIEAKFSLQHAVAVTLADGPPQLSAFAPEVLSRADFARIRTKTRVLAVDAFTSRYPAHFGASVALTLTDGTTRRAAVADALGDPENPLASDAVVAKARMLMRHAGLGAARIAGIVTATQALADDAPVRDMTRFLPLEGPHA